MATLPPRGSSVRILAIDGGAMMGVIPARILSYLDGSAYQTNPSTQAPISDVPALQGKSLYENFDIVIGTSIGGLIASCLTIPPLQQTAPLTAAQILKFFFDEGSRLFPLLFARDAAGNPQGNFHTWQNQTSLTATAPLFDNVGFSAALAEKYGNPSWAKSLQYQVAPSGLSRAFAAPPVAIDPTPDGCATLNQALTGLLITTFNGNPGAPQPNVVYGAGQGAQPWTQAINGQTPFGPLLLSNDTQCANPYTGSAQTPLSLLQACLMTTAALAVLPPVPFDLQYAPDPSRPIDYYLDGGVWTINPTVAAFLLAGAMDYDITCLVSIGCGETASVPLPSTYPTVFNWGSGLSLSGLAGQGGWLLTLDPLNSPVLLYAGLGLGQFATAALAATLGPERYFRVQPLANDIPATPPTRTEAGTPANPPRYFSSQAALNAWVACADSYVSACVTGNNPRQEITVDWQAMIHAINGDAGERRHHAAGEPEKHHAGRRQSAVGT